MKFDIKLNSKINIKQITETALHVWRKMHTPLFFFALSVAIVIGGYVWKQNVYSGEWSEVKKREYLNTQNKEVIFKEDAFQKVSDDILLRKEENLKEYQPIKDVFKPY
jgi:hypothetical protein